MTDARGIALVATVRNERHSLDAWFRALQSQTRPADELIVVDGGSTDGTWEYLQSLERRCVAPLRLMRIPGATIAAGRNAAIDAASCDVIAVTDAGTIACSAWLEQLARVMDDPRVDVASGFFIPALGSPWERALAATTLPDVSEIREHRFLPSSRSLAFRASWFRAGFRYPQWLDVCEDVVWDLQLRRAGARFRFASRAVVAFHVRQSPRAFWLQYYRYARGDGKSGLFAARHLARYVAYATAALVVLRRRPLEQAALLGLAGSYLRAPVGRLWKRDRLIGAPVWSSLMLVPAVAALRAYGDAAKMTGYPIGLAWRLRRFGALGRRTTWRRISYDGRLWRP